MTGRTRRAAPRKTVRQQGEVGAVARLVDRAFDDPATAGGMFVLTLTIMAIMSNAMFLQPTSHPQPLFQTRAAMPPPVVTSPTPAVAATGTETDVVDPAAPVPRVRTTAPVAPADLAVPPPAPERVAATPAAPQAAQPQPAQPQAAAPTPADTASAEKALTVDIQRGLARIGLYSGAIDGIAGPRTSAAISRYQAAAGVAVDGKVSTELLQLLQRPTPPVPLAPRAPETTGTVAAPANDLAALEQRSLALEQRAVLTSIQSALNKIGYGPLVVDGEPGPDTVNAIRRFELDNGLDVSGRSSPALIDRLTAIGALTAG